MRIDQHDMKQAAEAGIITTDQAQQLWAFWQKSQEDMPQFRLSHVMYYFGGLLAISAVTLFVTEAWDALVGLPLAVMASLLFLAGLMLSHYFLNRKFAIPAGIMATFSLALVPLIVYNLQMYVGWKPGLDHHYANFHFIIKSYWFPMELSTLLAGLIMLFYYRFPFLVFPVAITLWYMSMDMFPLLFPMGEYLWQAWFSVCFGLLYILVAVLVDLKFGDERHDYAYWLYIVGVVVFWSGLSFQVYSTEFSKLIYCLISVLMVFVGVFLNRRVFTVFGVMGVFSYLGYLSFSIFANSLGFPLVLVLLGVMIIFLATRWVRFEQTLMAWFKPYIPQKLLDRMRDQ